MTKEQKSEVFSLRLDGKTLSEIAKMFGCSRQYIHQVLKGSKKRPVKVDKIVYPGIKSWMIESQTRISGLERIAGVTAGCLHTALKSQGMNMATIRAVLKATGLTFEAAFGGCVAQEAHDEQS